MCGIFATVTFLFMIVIYIYATLSSYDWARDKV